MFLDFDGPLFSTRALMLAENNEYAQETLEKLKLHSLVSYWYADPVAIAMLIELYRFKPYQLVISSNWANEELHSKEQIENLLKHNGLGIPFHINWTLNRNNYEKRVEQIKEWLDNNEYSDYIIIDDHDSGVDMNDEKQLKQLGMDKNKIVLVNFDDGLLTKDFYQAKAIMDYWN